jgi:glycosyltransferase involved in cell wall biosynthesis
MPPHILIVVAALDEADRISSTLAALALAFPGSPVWVADDGSTDATPGLARAAGATIVRSERVIGKGQAMTAGVRAALERVSGEEAIVVLCDGDLDDSARELSPLVDAIRRGEADLAIAAFSTRVTGGFGLVLAFARWAVGRRCGLSTRAPLSGQRAMRAAVLRDVLPFASGFGMETGMTIDAVRAGHRVREVDLSLSHRPTGRSLSGFLHRGRQLVDVVRAYLARR